MSTPPAFPARLAWWRKRRGLSQLALATAAVCSQRHLGFLELGRASPSREMVLRLAAALDLPLRGSNELLLAAGYAPVWTELDFAAPALDPVREALDRMLAQQEPFPAVVVERRWNLLRANRGAVAMVEFLVGPLAPGAAVNLAEFLRADHGQKHDPGDEMITRGTFTERPITEALLWHLYDHGRGLYQAGIQRNICCVPVCAAWRRP